MKVIYLLGFILVFGVYDVLAQGCHMRELDLCAATVLVYARNPRDGVPVDEVGLNKQCLQLREAASCLYNYTRKCCTPLQRELISFVTQGAGQLLNEYCTPGTDLRRNYLKHATCLREVAGSTATRNCLADVQASLDKITDVPENPFALGCCTYNRFRKCADQIVESRCGKEAIEFANIMLRMGLSNVVDRSCGCIDPESSECQGVLPPPGTRPQGTRSNSPMARLFAVFLGPQV